MKRFARISSGIAIAIGILVLLGWLFNLEPLKRVLPDLVAMNPTSALGFILAGFSLGLLEPEAAATRKQRQAGFVLAAMVALLGLIKFSGFLLRHEIDIDQFLFTSKLFDSVTHAPNRMAPNTALNFLLVGLALLTLDWKIGERRYPAQYMGLATSALALLALTGYALEANRFYHVGAFIPMALHTAFTFLVMSLGILLARPDRGFLRVFGSRGVGGKMARRILPATILIPLVLGLLRSRAEKAGYVGMEFGVALMVVSTIALLVTIIFWNANSLDRADKERLQAETALRKSLRQIQDLYDGAPCGYHSVDANGVMIAMNDTELRWLGYSREEIIGKKNIADLLTPESREKFQKIFPHLKKCGSVENVEYDLLRKDDSVLPVLLNATGAWNESDIGISTRFSLFDITARKRAEEERNRFFMLSLDLFCIAGFDGYFKNLNPVWESTLGYSREELMAIPFLELIHPDDRASTAAKAASVADGNNVVSFANRYRCKDGSYRWLLWNAKPVMEQKLMYAAAHDITEQKKQDEVFKKLTEELQSRSQQLETLNKELEAFSYSVSHDLRAPLRHIGGFVDLLSKQETGKDSKADRYLKLIADSTRQMGNLIDDLLSFSRMSRSEMHLGLVNLSQMVSEIRQHLAPSYAERALTFDVAPLPEVEGDYAMLRLALVNLLANAIKYTGKRPEGRIEIGCATDDEGHTIFVRDNGVGFDMKYAGKLFGVFQRLHHADEFEGTGIGLANVRRIIHRHGGRTWAEAAPDKGATIFFFLPRKAKTDPTAIKS